MHYYFSNGLFIESEIKIPVFTKNNFKHNPDLQIKQVEELTPLENIFYEDKYQKISDLGYEINTPSNDKIQYIFPSEILMKKCNENDLDVNITYLLQTIMPIAMMFHQKWPLHSCCVNVNGQGVLFGGVSGSGKSTFAMGMRLKGYEVYNDDISTIETISDKAYVNTGYQQIKLLPESIEHFGYEPDDFEKVNDDFTKYRVLLENKSEVTQIPVKAIYFLEKENPENKLAIEKLNGMNSLAFIIKNIFRVEVVKSIKKSNFLFENCSKIATTVPCYKVFRPLEMAPSEFHNYMEQKITL